MFIELWVIHYNYKRRLLDIFGTSVYNERDVYIYIYIYVVWMSRQFIAWVVESKRVKE